MSRRVKDDQLIRFVRQMSDVIETYGYYEEMWTAPALVVKVRWDTPIFRPSNNATEVLHARLQDLLKCFESLTIDQRILNRQVIDRLMFVAQGQDPGAILRMMDTINAKSEVISERFSECEFQFKGFIFEYSNNDFLPTITMRPINQGKYRFV